MGMRAVFAMVLAAVCLQAQQPLALKEAVELALRNHPVMEAADAGQKQAEAGIDQAKAGHYPRVQFSESYQRSNNPVFVFGSLLNQRQFSEANFDVDLLNNPSALNNFQSRLSIEQPLFDSRRTHHAVRAAGLRTEIAGEQKRRSEADVILGVVSAYFGAVLAEEQLRVAEESVKTAAADLKRAEALFEAGMTTEADILSVRVHLAAMEEERIRAANGIEVARAAVNDALGAPLDQAYELTTPLTAPSLSPSSMEEYEQTALKNHPELRQAVIQENLAEAEFDLAKTAYWPELVALGVLEADRQRLGSRAGGNWLAGVSLRWNLSLWNGSETRARVAGARFARLQAEAMERRAGSAIRLRVRRAYFDLQSAAERVSVAAAAVSQAEESHRIIQNRYQAGLTTVTELIRSQTALMAAQTRRLAALFDQRVAAAALDHAAGNLIPASEALR